MIKGDDTAITIKESTSGGDPQVVINYMGPGDKPAEKQFDFTHVAYHGYLVEWHKPEPDATTVAVLTLSQEKPIARIAIDDIEKARELTPGIDDMITPATWNSPTNPTASGETVRPRAT